MVQRIPFWHGCLMRIRIREAREAAKLSQEALGALANTSGAQISRLETEERRLTVDWINRVAKALGVPALSLLVETDSSVEDGPIGGEFVQDPEALALIRVYKAMPPAARDHLVNLLRELGPGRRDAL